MVIPFIYLLIGCGMWVIARTLKLIAGKRLSQFVVLGVVMWGTLWSTKYYFRDMWTKKDMCEMTWNSSRVRTSEAALELAKDGYQVLLNGPFSYWKYLIDYGSNSHLELYEEFGFRSDNWLPENWDYQRKAIVLSHNRDGAIFDILKKWAPLYKWEEKFFPVGETKLLLGKISRSKNKHREGISPEPVSLLLDGVDYNRWDGSVMLREHCNLSLVKQPHSARIFVDEELLSPGEKNNLLPSGLHNISIMSPVHEKEPAFELEIYEPATGASRKARLTPSMLYIIPVYGWSRTTRLASDPSKLVGFAVEPFLHYNGIWNKKFDLHDHLVHEWRSIINIKGDEVMPVKVSWRDGDVTAYINGVEMPKSKKENIINFTIDNSNSGQETLIRWKTKGPYLLIRLVEDAGESPPYKTFLPVAGI